MGTPPRRRLSPRLLYGLYLAVAAVLLLEVALRAWFAVEVGPRVLAYGTPWHRNEADAVRTSRISQEYEREAEEWAEGETRLNTIYKQGNLVGGYRKFFPDEAKYHRDIDTGEVFRVAINSHGLRGQDFTVHKPEGVLRVLTLGASSTFGFFNREHETYPAQLEVLLNERCPGQRHEVINFAVPKAKADSIRAMLVAEGLALDPDVLTFYEGRNDSDQLHPLDFRGGTAEGVLEDAGPLRSAWLALGERILVVRFVEQALSSRAVLPGGRTTETIEGVAAQTSREFLNDLREIQGLAVERGVPLILANQQANSKSWFGLPEAERLALKGVTYGEEVEGIRARLRRGESVSGYEANFLVHARLMHDLEGWARAEGLPFVDVIDLLDQDRQHLVSYVHLDPYANGVIAAAFADEVLRHTCPTAGAGESAP